MDWVLRSPQIYSTFGNLGFVHGDGYQVNENCNAALETILQNILTEDKYLRTYRRCISFGQNIKKDLIPLLIHTKENQTVELLIKILVNLTIPVECLLCVDMVSRTDVGRHTIFEINNLLVTAKAAFTDNKATKVLIEFLKKNLDLEQKSKLSVEQCTNISNSLLLLRNILHIPEDTSNPSCNGSTQSVQNQILWNIFSQSVDKVLIKLITIPDASNWGVTMVQLIALLYKDQHVVTLHKLLNMWLETALSESSEDNESNTSPPDRGSEDSSPTLTSDPTSDCSDTGGSGKCIDEPNSVKNEWLSSSGNKINEDSSQSPIGKEADGTDNDCMDVDPYEGAESTKEEPSSCDSVNTQRGRSQKKFTITEKKVVISENSDCGYGTQIENPESISTSSNEDELPAKKPVHQKPHNAKQRITNKARVGISPQERKRKKIVKRGKATIINVQGLTHKTPTDDEISNVLKEFTVDFLLKGYNSLVQILHNQILTNMQLEIDTSHFFWLITYFLKFATQIELDLEHVSSVLSFEIVSYLTAEGVNLCEQFELAIKLDGNDLKPTIRRLHLVVTAIREIVQAIDSYKKFSHICNDDRKKLVQLQIKMCETEELRSLLVLLLRHYNPNYHTKQYLQDLIVTNHILLIFLDVVIQLPDYDGSVNMVEHIKQFATPDVMYQYGLLLEDYSANGEYVNDCIFTLMHHVGGDLGCLMSLFQPKILKSFTSIWKSEFEICDDWSDLIEYVINTSIKSPHTLIKPHQFRLDEECQNNDIEIPDAVVQASPQECADTEVKKKSTGSTVSANNKWTEDELSSLSWNYMQCKKSADLIGDIVQLFKEEGVIKTKDSVIRELFKQSLISRDVFETLSKGDAEKNIKSIQVTKEMRDDETGKLCEQLGQDGKNKFLDWVQRVLLETCFAKIYLEKESMAADVNAFLNKKETKTFNFELLNKESNNYTVISPTSYHALNSNQAVPLVPWNCEQAAICKDLKFLQLLHKLGFHMPVDTGKVFIRIPNFWSADFLYEMAGKISSIDKTKLKFSITDIPDNSVSAMEQNNFTLPADLTRDLNILSTPDNFYQRHKQRLATNMVNFTPMPGSSYNSDCGEINKQNWLEVVQRSQECKTILNVCSSESKNEDVKSTIAIELSLKDEDGFVPPPTVAPIANPAHLALPTIMSTKHECTSCNNICEAEFSNHSICETASVASDLTRMYVSDEDEKIEIDLRPNIAVNSLPVMDESTDLDAATPEKRPRVEFIP